jgi:micrococcal nuclease
MKLPAAALISLLLGFAPECRSCECAGGDPKSFLESASVVFEGRVEAMQIRTHALFEGMTLTERTTTAYMVFTLKVGRIYKGSLPKSVKVATGIGTADGTAAPDCSFPFEIGKDYLVYAQSGIAKYGGLLATSICSGTDMINGARFYCGGTEMYLRYLRGRPPRKEDTLSYEEYSKLYESRATAQISGKIDGLEKEEIYDDGLWRFVDGEWLKWAFSDTKLDGSYSFSHLEPGKYRIGFFQIHEDGSRKIGFYGNAERLEDARSISVGPKSHVKGIDITLKPQSRHVVQGKIECSGGNVPNGKIKIRIANSWDHYDVGKIEIKPCDSFQIPGIYSGTFRVIAAIDPEGLDPLDVWTINVPDIKVPEEARNIVLRLKRERLPERATSLRYSIWDILKGTSTRILTGDKIVFEVNEYVLGKGNSSTRGLRIASIQCPQEGENWWEEARNLTAKLLLGKALTFSIPKGEADDSPMQYEDSPGFYVSVPHGAASDIAKALIKAGLARHYRKYSADPELDKLETEARKAGRGIWSKSGSR